MIGGILKLLGGTIGLIFLIGLLVVIGLLALIF
ncbi:small membrane protein YohP [Teichococcus aestuarii]